MIDFGKDAKFKLKPVDNQDGVKMVDALLVGGEEVIMTFQASRDMVIFTNKRLIAVNVQGMTGKKKDFSSLPYARIQAFGVETAGNFDLDSELELWFSGLGKIKLEFGGKVDIRALCKFIGEFALK